MPHLSFKKKFILLLLLVSIIPTILIGIISYEIGKDSLYERIGLDLKTQASHIMDQVDRFLYERHNDTQLLISDSVFIDTEASIEKKSSTLKEYLINLGLYDNIHLLSLDGDVIASTYSADKYANFAEEAWFKDTKKLFYYTSDIQYSSFSKKPTIFFSNIILDSNNEPKGMIVAELMWPVVTEFIENVPKPAEAILLNKNNLEIGGGVQEDVLVKDWSEQAGIGFADSAFLVTDVPSNGYLVYRGNDWKLVLRTPVDEALAPLNRLFVLIALFLLGIVIVIVATGLFFGNRFIKPIRELTQGAEEIKKGNLNQKINVKSKDELGFLALTFNDMAKSLKDEQTKLRHEIEKEKELEKVKDEIWTTASHNLRTPLTGINWLLEMLTKGLLGKLNAKQTDAVDQINKNTSQLNYLVNILLDVSKLESGKIKITKSEFFLEDILEKAIKRNLVSIKEKKIKVETPSLKQKKIKMFLDPDKTQQVFNALLDNAVIYNVDKGKISIVIKTEGKRLVCSITDTGIGISQKDMKAVFDKFKKGENSETKNAQGIGLGLYLANIIAKSSGGKLYGKSTLGKGSTFYAELPLK